jgi:hypothetical protein
MSKPKLELRLEHRKKPQMTDDTLFESLQGRLVFLVDRCDQYTGKLESYTNQFVEFTDVQKCKYSCSKIAKKMRDMDRYIFELELRQKLVNDGFAPEEDHPDSYEWNTCGDYRSQLKQYIEERIPRLIKNKRDIETLYELYPDEKVRE